MLSAESHKAIEIMNKYGNQQIPFIFLIDFEMRSPIVVKLADVDGSILYKVGKLQNHFTQSAALPKLQFEKYPIDYEKYLSPLTRYWRILKMVTHIC